MAAVHRLCEVVRLQEGRGWPARAGDRWVAVFLVAGDVRVVDNVCPHNGSPLDLGSVETGDGDGAVLVCPWHGWTFDLATGHLCTTFGPRPGVAVHEAWVEDGYVVARLSDG